MQKNTPPRDLYDETIETLFRHKKKILTIPLVVVACGVLAILFYPRTYSSEARMFIQVGRESIGIDPTAQTQEMISIMQSGRDDEMTSAIDLLQSRAILGQVVDNLSPDYVLNQMPGELPHPFVATLQSAASAVAGVVKSIDPVSPREQAIVDLEESFAVEVERGSTVLKLRVEADSAIIAQRVLQEVVDVFQDAHMEMHRNPDSKKFFVEQLEVLRGELRTAQSLLRDAKDELGIVSVEDRRDTLEGELRQIELAKYEAQQELARSMATIDDLAEQIVSIPPRETGDRKSLPNEGADQLVAQLYALKVRQLDLKSRYSDDHPRVVAIDAQVREAQRVVDAETTTREEVTDRVNPIHEKLSLQLKIERSSRTGLEARLETLAEQWKTIMQDLRLLNESEIKIRDLQRELDLAESQYYRYAEDFEQARIDSELQEQKISNIRVPQQANLMEKPVSPSKAIVALGTLLLALGLTASSVFFSERMNDRLRTEAEVEQAIEVPVFARISKGGSVGRVLS